jgi:hypothetical protein
VLCRTPVILSVAKDLWRDEILRCAQDDKQAQDDNRTALLAGCYWSSRQLIAHNLCSGCQSMQFVNGDITLK